MTAMYGTNGALVNTAGAQLVPSRFKDGIHNVLFWDSIAFTNANVIGDTAFLGTYKSTALITPGSSLYFGAFGAGVTLNVGDVNHVSGLIAGLDVHAAGSANLYTLVAGHILDPLWKRLGYASDPGGTITLLATVAGANVANAVSLDLQVNGANA